MFGKPSWHYRRPTSTPTPVPVSFKYAAEAIALLGIAYALIKWVGRSLRSVVSDTSHEQYRLEALGSSNPAAAADMLVRQGLVSAEQLAAMTPRERDFLVATAGRQVRGAARSPNEPSAPLRPTPAHAQRATPATRLHLITPSRPPLGVAVHCPGCGTPLDREALQRHGTTPCPRCKRPVSAHIQHGRVTVIVEETNEEAEYRRRLESR